MFNTAVGAFAAYKAGPFQDAAAHNYVLFRKTWMKAPIRLAAFGGAYYVANQLQNRFFPRLPLSYWRRGGMTNANAYLANQDLISKFRIFEDSSASADAKNEISSYLDVYNSGPLNKAEMLNRFKQGKPVDPEFSKNFQIKRRGKDANDVFWKIGKIHGLENIAFMKDEDIPLCGNPWEFQVQINKVMDEPKPIGPGNFDKLIE